MRGNRRKHVAAVECGADVRQKVTTILQSMDGFDFFGRQRPTENAVIRPHEIIVCRLHSNCPARTAYAGVNYCNMNRAFGEKSATGLESECPNLDASGGNLMGNIHHNRLWVNAQDHTFHRACKPVPGAEVSR